METTGYTFRETSTEHKLHKVGFTVLMTVRNPTPSIYKLKEVSVGYEKWELVSEHKYKSGMLRELASLLKNGMTVVINEPDRNHNDKLVSAGLTIIRLDKDTKRIKKWYSHQAWRTFGKYESLQQAEDRYKELLMEIDFIEG